MISENGARDSLRERGRRSDFSWKIGYVMDPL